jgi:hypothetical protein
LQIEDFRFQIASYQIAISILSFQCAISDRGFSLASTLGFTDFRPILVAIKSTFDHNLTTAMGERNLAIKNVHAI